MDALTLGAIGLAISAFVGVFIWAVNDGKREQERRLKADIDRLTTANKQKGVINEVQANPFDFERAAKWVRDRKSK